MDGAAFWEERYGTTSPAERSWTEAVPASTLAAIQALGCTASDVVLDVGGGSSTLVDTLLDWGFTNVIVVDLAASALHEARTRLGDRGRDVTFIVGDLLEVDLGCAVDLWHDRAVLHFLVDPDDQARYVDRLEATVGAGGAAILEVFGPDGPAQCSGLDVRRWSTDELVARLGPRWTPVLARTVVHVTPWGSTQAFSQVAMRRR